ncbi:hypothetical protein LJC19_04855 [Oxalobacter sp. OttesenSCG-928-P03]|nr:hypothetical protein [Oxalobacter sp. OttesenSCG-928-P03]
MTIQTTVANTQKEINEAFALALANYNARNKSEVTEQADLKAGYNTFAKMSDGQIIALGKLGVDWSEVAKGLGNATNVKIARRLPQFLGFVISGDASYLKGSALTALLEYVALGLGAKNKDALRFASTGQGNEHTSDSGIDIEQARKMLSAFGAVHKNSRNTQASVSFSKGGLLEILGIAKSWSRSEMPEIVNSKLTRAINKLVNNATDGQVSYWAEESKSRKAKKA